MLKMTIIALLLSLNVFSTDREYGSLNVQLDEIFVGVLERVAGIGGESTGIALKTDDGQLFEVMGENQKIQSELEFLVKYSMDDSMVFKGRFITVRGVEIRERKIFVVKLIDNVYRIPNPRIPTPVQDTRICGSVIRSMYNPETGACMVGRSSCEIADLKEEGFITDTEAVCGKPF